MSINGQPQPQFMRRKRILRKTHPAAARVRRPGRGGLILVCLQCETELNCFARSSDDASPVAGGLPVVPDRISKALPLVAHVCKVIPQKENHFRVLWTFIFKRSQRIRVTVSEFIPENRGQLVR